MKECTDIRNHEGFRTAILRFLSRRRGSLVEMIHATIASITLENLTNEKRLDKNNAIKNRLKYAEKLQGNEILILYFILLLRYNSYQI